MMPKLKNIVGKKYTRWTVVSRAENRIMPNGKARIMWNCICDCGAKSIVFGQSLASSDSKSCGCLKSGNPTHGMSYKPIYKIWAAMKYRCLNKNDKRYRDYGGRGISVCNEWLNSFERFYSDMGSRPNGMSLDRKDNDGDYTPENCKWSTQKEQSANMRNNLNITYNGTTMTATQWSRKLGGSDNLVSHRIHLLNWDNERAVTIKPANTTGAIK